MKDLANKELLSFVLPVATKRTGRDSFDLLRVRRLLTSLDRFVDRDSLDQLIVVTPADDLAITQDAVAEFVEQLRIQVVEETQFCPELTRNPDTSNLWPRPNTGWFRQQLIKLAAHAHVRTSFYMTLDADVVFVRPFDGASLIKDGRAVLGMLTADDLRALFKPEVAAHEIGVRRHRIAQAEGVLGLTRPGGLEDAWYGETPAVLARDVVAGMARHLEATWETGWREALLQRLPWTEYALYGVFAEATGLMDALHQQGGMDAVLRLSDSLWRQPEDYITPRDLNGWDVAKAFGATADGVAIVVQSYLGYSESEVASLIEARLYR